MSELVEQKSKQIRGPRGSYKFSIKTLDKTREYIAGGYEDVCSGKFPSATGLAIYLGVGRDTLIRWGKDGTGDGACPIKGLFGDMLDDIHMRQRETLINHGLDSTYNATIVKLVLSSQHDMVEKRETTTHVNVSVTDLSDSELERKLKQLERECLVIEQE